MLSDNDTMKLYMQNIGQYPLITPAEEVELAARIAKGDAEARTILIRSNLRLVVKIAHDFKGLGLPLLDLISEGNIGLMRAV
ncbi:MAG: RNA polymerase sigma factor RpoD/SigA, partial [Lentisphaerae bacterium]|nr:RNA polymerase sigma factor RpoD/SigA [Lentisphaerota bacterium]